MSLIKIQGKIIGVKPAKTGYYVAIQEQKTGEHWRAFSRWRPEKETYSLVLRRNNKYFFIVSWQVIDAETAKVEPVKQTVYQPYEEKDKRVQRQLIKEYQTKINQLQTELQQWKNAYYNQKSMLKLAQQNAHQRTVENRIQAIKTKPGRKSKQDLDYLKVLSELSQEYQENVTWLSAN